MGIVSVVLLILFIVACIMLILIVLVQDEHGEGLGGLFGGSAGSFGPRTGNVLTRFTAILAAVFLVGAFALAWLNRTPELGDVVGKARLQALQQEPSQDWWVQTTPSESGTEGGETTAGAATSGAATAPSAGAGAAQQQPSDAPETEGSTPAGASQ